MNQHIEDFETLGDRMKGYEQRGFCRDYINPGEAFIVRLDGRAFHTFTKNIKKPFDPVMSTAMTNTMKALTAEFNADVGYCQSDEISLVFLPNVEDQLVFGGRVQKIISLLAARASVIFNIEIWNQAPSYIKEGSEPIFDARIIPVPSRVEALNNIIWRQRDAVKNAISMAAHAYFPHTELHKLTGAEKQEKLFSEMGINFNDYPPLFKRGIFARRETVNMAIDEETLSKMPPHVAAEKHGQTFERRVVETFDCWIDRAGDTIEERFNAVFPSKGM